MTRTLLTLLVTLRPLRTPVIQTVADCSAVTTVVVAAVVTVKVMRNVLMAFAMPCSTLRFVAVLMLQALTTVVW